MKKDHTLGSIFDTFLKNPFASKRRKGECRFGTDFFIYRFWTGHEDFKEHGQARKRTSVTSSKILIDRAKDKRSSNKLWYTKACFPLKGLGSQACVIG